MQVEQQSAEIKDTKTVELLFNGESKIGQLAVSPSEDYWNSLEKLFHASYPSIEAGVAIQAKYIDDEGDLIVLDSDDELRNALNNAVATKPNPLRLELFLANDQGEKKKRIKRTREERLQIKADRLKAKEERLNLGDADQEKIQKKKARIEEKLKRKQERQEKKKHLSREERLALKEEKVKKREEKKKNMRMQGEGDEEKKKKRREERMKEREERKKKTNVAYHDLAKEEDNSGVWPEHATHLFLDGNNMMFVTGGLRSLTLHHNRAKAEQLLEAAAHAFVVSQAGRIQQATVIFDNTHTDKSVLLEVEGGSGVASVPFRVCSARPQWPTSDDALIEWAKEAQKKKEADCMAVVTSDRALSVQLQEAGATLIKPKQFLHFAFKTVTKNQNGSGDAELDAWLESLIA